MARPKTTSPRDELICEIRIKCSVVEKAYIKSMCEILKKSESEFCRDRIRSSADDFVDAVRIFDSSLRNEGFQGISEEMFRRREDRSKTKGGF